MDAIKSGIKGIKWVTFAKVVTQLFQFITIYIFAQLLEPEDFGIMGLAFIIIGVLNVFQDLGTSQALVQKETHNNTILSSAFYFTLLLSMTFFLIVYFPSIIWTGLVANTKSEQLSLLPVLEIMSLGFLINGIGTVPKAILERKLFFNKIALIEIMGTFSGSLLGIFLAYAGYGVYSLVFQYLVFSLILSIGYWMFAKWRPKLVFRMSDIKTIQHYIVNLSAFNIINYFIRNADYILIGKFLGAQALGYYTLAYKIMLFPIQNISNIVSRVFFPVYSKLQNNDVQFRQLFNDVANWIALITFPLMAGIFILSSPIIELFFDDKWHPIIPVLMILAPVGLLQSISVTSGSIYQAKGRTDWMFRWGIVSGIVTVGGFAIGLNWGIKGVAFSYLVTNLLLFLPTFIIPFKLISQSLFHFLNRLKMTSFSSLIMLITIWVTSILLGSFNEMGKLVFIALLISIGIIIYFMVSFTINKHNVSSLITLIKSK